MGPSPCGGGALRVVGQGGGKGGGQGKWRGTLGRASRREHAGKAGWAAGGTETAGGDHAWTMQPGRSQSRPSCQTWSNMHPRPHLARQAVVRGSSGMQGVASTAAACAHPLPALTPSEAGQLARMHVSVHASLNSPKRTSWCDMHVAGLTCRQRKASRGCAGDPTPRRGLPSLCCGGAKRGGEGEHCANPPPQTPLYIYRRWVGEEGSRGGGGEAAKAWEGNGEGGEDTQRAGWRKELARPGPGQGNLRGVRLEVRSSLFGVGRRPVHLRPPCPTNIHGTDRQQARPWHLLAALVAPPSPAEHHQPSDSNSP